MVERQPPRTLNIGGQSNAHQDRPGAPRWRVATDVTALLQSAQDNSIAENPPHW